jgi:hypothetical protein
MKKIYFPVVVVMTLLMFAAFACKSNTDKQETKDTQKSSNETQKTNASSESASQKETTETIVKLSADEQKNLNVFFSNFSEVGLEPFAKGKLTDEALINFGVLHLYKNNKSLFEKTDAVNAKIKEDKVSESVQKYFGVNIASHKSTKQFKYKNGYYFIPLADGEVYTFSQVERLTDNGGDLYTAYVNVYTAGSGWTGDANGLKKDWEKDGSEVPVFSGKYKAVFGKKNTGNVLVEYVKQ